MKRALLLLVVAATVGAGCSQPNASETADGETPSSTTTTTTTATPTTTTTVDDIAGIIPGEDADVDAVILAYQIVFSSETEYEEKAPYIEDPEGLEESVAQYQETGTSMGGVELAPTSVMIDGDTAEVIYDLLFGGTPTYPGLSGDAVLRDETWKITRDMFCAMMASARVDCPEA